MPIYVATQCSRRAGIARFCAAGAALLQPMLESACPNRIEATLSVPAGNENGSGAWFKPRY